MWKRRAEELKQRELIAEQEKVHALQERDSVKELLQYKNLHLYTVTIFVDF